MRCFVLVVLENWRAECWITGVSECCAYFELHPVDTGLEVLCRAPK
jgi:hypothetical protein